jgi:threonine aldolase
MIDLRSDTVTRPTEAMRRAMAAAEVGDDVYGEDPTVRRLEAMAAERLGMESGLFVPSGTQGNLAALMAHCERGDEYIVGHNAHTYQFEGGGAAVLGSIQPQPVPLDEQGCMDLDAAMAAIKPDDAHFARTRLLCLENTWWGKALPMPYLKDAEDRARARGLGMHLDGARLFNAAVAHECPVSDISRHFDSVSFCLSKGLGAPVGSVVCGHQDLIERARRWRKVLGGGMRQAGIIAAAGIHALDHHVDRLADDHRRATQLADALEAMAGVRVFRTGTNMVMLEPEHTTGDRLAEALAAEGIRVNPGSRLRLVTHLDVGDVAVNQIIAIMPRLLDRLSDAGQTA